jgi:hypothetical protein
VQAEATGHRGAERADDPPVLRHPGDRRTATATVAAGWSPHLHDSTVTHFPLPYLNLWKIAANARWRSSPDWGL